MTILLLVHVLSAVLSIGALAAAALLIAAARSAEEQRFVARVARLIDLRLATPALTVSLITGIGVQHMSKIPTTTPWVLGALGLWFVMLGVQHGYVGGALRRANAAFTAGNDGAPQLARARNGLALATALGLAVVVLMVLKPV